MRWLIAHAFAMDTERIQRYRLKAQELLKLKEEGKPHAPDIVNSAPAQHFCIPFINWVQLNLQHSLVPEGSITEFAQAMPDEFKCEDSVQAYRNFYIAGKQHLHKWIQNKPDWISA
jgi:hypothetical protein